MGNAIWAANIADEVAFWEGVVRREAADGAASRGPTVYDESWLLPLLDPAPAAHETLRLLDVGSGPFSTLGVAAPGSRVEIVATDALGEMYNALLSRFGLNSFPRIQAIKGEDLSRNLGRDQFHLVNCANALDHFEDPVAAFGEMIRVCRPGGIIMLVSIENEGERESYEGLHQWNLQADDSGIWLWNRSVKANLLARHKPDVSYRWEYVDHGQTDCNIFVATLQKRDIIGFTSDED